MFFSTLMDSLSQSWFFTAYGFAAATLFGFVIHLLALKSNPKHRPRRLIFVPLFLLHLGLIYQIQSPGSIWVLNHPKGDMPEPVPYLLNSLLLVPIGFLLPIIWESFRHFFKVATTVFLFAALLELSHYLSMGSFQQWPILFAIAGAATGYGLYLLLFRVLTRNSLMLKSHKGLQMEPLLYLITSFLGMFLLYNPALLVPEAHPLAHFFPDYVIDPTVTPIQLESPLPDLLADDQIHLEETALTIQLFTLEGEIAGTLLADLSDLEISETDILINQWQLQEPLTREAQEILPEASTPLSVASEAQLIGNQIREDIFAKNLVLRHYETPLTLDLSQLQSPYALLMELDRGRVLVDQQDGFRYPASMTKIMSALLAIEHFQDLDELVFIEPEMLSNIPWYATIAGFEAGTYVTARDLIYGILLPSGADATHIAAIAISQSVENFVLEMNKRAYELGMADTHFVNPVGLHDDAHQTTLTDLVTLFAYAWGLETFQGMITTRHYSSENGLEMESTLFGHPLDFEIANGTLLGGRTGFTFEAGRSLISIAYINGRHYILATGGAPNSSLTPAIEDALYLYNQL